MSATLAYSVVNRAINEVFFDGRLAGQPAYLSLDNRMREEFARILGGPASIVEDAACASVGRWLEKVGDPYARALSDMRVWRDSGMASAPPFAGILFCLAHAAAIMAADEGFGSNNYYDRLAQVTGVPRDALALHGKSTERLWAALNEWLLQHNFELGRPTARAINSWKYVGLAISQAIVRAGDREQFHDLFERYSFSGSEAISLPEMEQYLSHWMASSKPGSRLKRAWQDPTLRDRVAEAAIAELASWATRAGDHEAGIAGSRRRRLALAAALVPKFPKAVLELQLGRMGEAKEEDPFFLTDSEDQFFLANDRYGGFATLSPSPLGAGGESLGQRQEFASRRGGRGLEWEPRFIIPFTRSQQGALWVEVARVAYGAPHLLLVRDANNLPKKVETYLAAAALAMAQKAVHGDIRGIPAGWVLYTDVQVGAPPEPPDKNLECLVPLGSDGFLSIERGLELLPGFYHSGVILAAKFVSAEGPIRIDVKTRSAVAVASCEAAGGNCAIELLPAALDGLSSIAIGVSRLDEPIESLDVYLRDANRPTPLSKDPLRRLAYQTSISASPRSDQHGLAVEGTIVHGDLADMPAEATTTSNPPPQGEDEEAQVATLAKALSTFVSNQVCVERGYHYWLCETLKPGMPRNTPLEQRCSGCGLSLIIANRGKKGAKSIPSHLMKVLPLRELQHRPSTLDHDLLLDALCFLGGGNWAKLQSLIGGNEDQPRLPRQVAEDYALLGFLDLELRTGTNSIKSWCVPQASLNFIDKEMAFLSGFRCRSLLDAIRDSINPRGGRLAIENVGGRPALVRVEGLEAGQAREALHAIRDPLGREVTVVDDAGAILVRACLGLVDPCSALGTASVGRPRNLQKFELPTARWKDVQVALPGAAYRWNEGLQAYAFIELDRVARQGPYQVVKLLAARRGGIRLHGYDATAGRFLSTLGCEPPGLLGRAMVAFSGRLPEVGHGLLSYRSVPKKAAMEMLHVLYPKGGRAG